MEKIDKNRYWTFIMYEDSRPDNWEEILRETGLEIGISPRHDRDIIEATGEIKKAHYHVLIHYPGPTTYEKVNKLCEELNSPIPKRVLSPIGIVRYFTHRDNPEKAQYSEEDIKGINGFDYREINQLTTSQENALKIEIVKLIKNNNISEYMDLVDYMYENQLLDMFRIVANNTIFFGHYLTSKRNKIDKERKL